MRFEDIAGPLPISRLLLSLATFHCSGAPLVISGTLVGSGFIDATRPQIASYEPTPNTGLKLIAADYLVLADR